MHHQSLNFPKSSFGESARHDDISLTAALDYSHKQKHGHYLELLYFSLQHGPVVWLVVTHVSEANTAIPRLKKVKSGERQILQERQYPHDPEAQNTSLHCRTSIERYECLSQSNCWYFFSYTYDHCTELHNTAEGTVTFQ